MRAAASLGALAFGLALVSGASATTLTFEDLVVGTSLSGQYAGVSFAPNAFSGAGTSSSGRPWATNTDMTIVSSLGTDAASLGSPALASGNILRSFSGWSREDGDPSFAINFASPANSFSITFAGVNNPGDVTLWFYNGNTQIGTRSGVTTGQFTLSFSAASITRVAVRPGTVDDWVGVDNIAYTIAAVPEAGTWAMMALGLGLLAFKRRHLA